MTNIIKRPLIIIAVAALVLPMFSCTGSAVYSRSEFGIFDTVCTLTAFAKSREDFEEGSDAVFDLLKECDSLFDIYRTRDGINNLKTLNDSAGIAPVKLDPRVLSLLELGIRMHSESGGALNIMLGSVLRLWHGHREADDGTLPDEAALKAAAEHTGIDSLIIDREAQTAYISDPEASVDVGAIAKGCAASLAEKLLPGTKLISALIDLGGNIVATGEKPDGSLWKVGIEKGDSGELLDRFGIAGGSVVTSGDYQRFFIVDGVRYHHIIDPETLYPASRWSQVSVVCSDAEVADALSTALFLMDKESGDELAKRYGARVYRVESGVSNL